MGSQKIILTGENGVYNTDKECKYQILRSGLGKFQKPVRVCRILEERESGRKTTLKFAAAVTGRLMIPLLDTGMSEGRARFGGMINNSERDAVRHQEELPDLEECDTMKIVDVCKNLL